MRKIRKGAQNERLGRNFYLYRKTKISFHKIHPEEW
jgi:hypothetical protein